MLSKLTRSFDYSHVNYIITTNTGCAYETYRSGIIGLLNGHLIKETKRANGLVSASRIETIETSHIKLMLFTIDGKDIVTLDIVDLIYGLHNNRVLEHRCYKTLKILYDNTLDVIIKDRINSFGVCDLKLCFIIDPLNYKGDIDIAWLKCVDDDSFKELIKRRSISALFLNPTVDHSLLRRYVDFSLGLASGDS